jgi:NADH-quinone oxidoreductase subunit E
MDKITEILQKFPDLGRESLIPVLQEVQDNYGYLPEEAMNRISRILNLPLSRIYGLSTFYNQFRFTRIGKYHIRICHGTGCHMKGSGKLLEEIIKLIGISDGQTTRDGIFSLELLSCIGACGQSPVISINGEYYEKVTKEKLTEIVRYYRYLEE